MSITKVVCFQKIPKETSLWVHFSCLAHALSQPEWGFKLQLKTHHSLIHSLIPQLFIDGLLCARNELGLEWEARQLVPAVLVLTVYLQQNLNSSSPNILGTQTSLLIKQGWPIWWIGFSGPKESALSLIMIFLPTSLLPPATPSTAFIPSWARLKNKSSKS